MRKSTIFIVKILLIGLFSALACALPLEKDAYAEFEDVKVYIDGTLLDNHVNGSICGSFLSDGTTYLPIRAIVKALGKTVVWDENNSIYIGGIPQLPVTEAKHEIIQIYVDGVLVQPEDTNGDFMEPLEMFGITYLPARILAKALNMDIGWDEDSNSVYFGKEPTNLIKRVHLKYNNDTFTITDIDARSVDHKYIFVFGNLNSERVKLVLDVENEKLLDLSYSYLVSPHNNEKYSVNVNGTTISVTDIYTKQLYYSLDLIKEGYLPENYVVPENSFYGVYAWFDNSRQYLTVHERSTKLGVVVDLKQKKMLDIPKEIRQDRYMLQQPNGNLLLGANYHDKGSEPSTYIWNIENNDIWKIGGYYGSQLMWSRTGKYIYNFDVSGINAYDVALREWKHVSVELEMLEEGKEFWFSDDEILFIGQLSKPMVIPVFTDAPDWYTYALKKNVKTGEEKAIPLGIKFAKDYVWCPNGKYVYYLLNDSLWKVYTEFDK